MAVVDVVDVDAWRELSSEHFVRLECRSLDRDFRGTMDMRLAADRLTVTRVRSGPIFVERTARLAHADDRDDLLLSLQLGSSGAVSQHGRTARLQPGSAALYDVRHPYRLWMPQRGQDLVVLRVPRVQLGLSDSAIESACARVFGRQDPGVAALGGFVSALTEDGAEAAGLESDLAAVTAQLVGSVVRGWFGRATMHTHSRDRRLLEELQGCIVARAWDPSFDVAALAQQSHLSVRKVHSLFAAQGQTPGACIRLVRLRAAAEMLRRPDMSGASVQTIAEQCGYLDVRTFTRAFRRHFGAPPAAWRRGIGMS